MNSSHYLLNRKKNRQVYNKYKSNVIITPFQSLNSTYLIHSNQINKLFIISIVILFCLLLLLAGPVDQSNDITNLLLHRMEQDYISNLNHTSTETIIMQYVLGE